MRAGRVILLIGAAAWALVSAPGHTAPASGRVLALLSSDAAPYREMLDGFKSQAGADVEVRLMGAGEAALAADIDRRPPRLIFAVGSSAAEFAARQNPRVPVLFGMVYYPERHGLLDREHVAGLSLRVPPAKTLEALELVRPDRNRRLRVGVVCPEGPESPELFELRAELLRGGHALVVENIRPGRDAAEAYSALLPRVEAIWLIADPASLPGPDFLASVLRTSLDRKVAVVGLSEAHVRSGALLAVSVDYRLEGAAAGRLAARILAGEKPAALGVQPPRNLVRSLNTRVAEELGWPVPRPARQLFERVYP